MHSLKRSRRRSSTGHESTTSDTSHVGFISSRPRNDVNPPMDNDSQGGAVNMSNSHISSENDYIDNDNEAGAVNTPTSRVSENDCTDNGYGDEPVKVHIEISMKLQLLHFIDPAIRRQRLYNRESGQRSKSHPHLYHMQHAPISRLSGTERGQDVQNLVLETRFLLFRGKHDPQLQRLRCLHAMTMTAPSSQAFRRNSHIPPYGESQPIRHSLRQSFKTTGPCQSSLTGHRWL